MENPNGFAVKIDRMNYTLKLNNKQMATGGIQEGFEVEKKGKKTIDIPVQIKYSDLIQFVKDLAKNKKTDYLLAGNVKSGPFDFPFEEKGDFALPIPEDTQNATSGQKAQDR
jgi:LEA14-like dessication related protein